MAEPPKLGAGRGGRGAMLLAALQKHHRRPGEHPEGSGRPPQDVPSSEPTPSQTFPMGRGALLSQHLRQAVPQQQQPPPEPQTPAQPVGMGRGAVISRLLQSVASQSASQPQPEPQRQLQHQPEPQRQPQPQQIAQPPSPKEELLAVAGRGRSLMQVTTVRRPASPVQQPASISESPPPASSSPPREAGDVPLVRKMSQLSIKGVRSDDFQGTSGTPCNMHMNYVKLQVKEGRGVFEYHVSFDPVVDSKNLRFRLLSQPESTKVLGRARTFDGAKLYLPFRLRDQVTNITAVKPTDGTPIITSVKFVRQCEPKDCIQFYNVLFRKVMNILKLVEIRRHYFNPNQSVPVPQHKLEIWPGFITAIHEYDGGLMLNCDASFRVLRTNTAHDILSDLRRTSRDIQTEAVQKLVGSMVLTRYNNRVYRIDDIDWSKSPRSTFTFHSGEEISFIDYYRRNYGLDINDLNQPLLIHRAKVRQPTTGKEEFQFLCLIPELCYMTGLTDDMRSDFKVMKDIAVHTRIAPTEREYAMTKFIDNINRNPEALQLLDEWGVKLEASSVGAPGRILPPETISFKDASVSVRKEADWGQDMSRNVVISAVDLENWIVLFAKRDGSKVNDFIDTFKRSAPPMGIRVRDPIRIELRDDRTDSYLRACKENVNRRVQLVVIVFPSSRDDKYSAVKKLCCSEMPVPSQVIIARTISQKPKLRAVTQKIALQINCKLGGELWAVDIPMKNILVCGIDVYHDPSRKAESVLGFVGSLNQRLTRWYSRVKFQQARQELGDCLKVALLETLTKYYQVNHMLPNRIFIYRDGVSDGQLGYVSNYEVEQMTSCFSHFGEGYNPQLVVVVVQKKINTKLFARLNGSGFENPPPGSVMDHTVTRKNMFDFFLVSQHVRQGTVSPTHYIVVHDSVNMKPDHMQRLSYKLTHLYYNWPGTIRVPAPCQYAHKLAYLVGQNIKKEPDTCLLDKLFFL